MTGRPSSYTQEIADEICALLADGKSLKKICEMDNMPSKATVFNWLAKNEAFLDNYTRAREAQADTLADEICDIADDGTNDYLSDENGRKVVNQEVIARSRLRVEARKWIASKLKPKKYGDRVLTENQALDKDGKPTDPAIQEVRITLVNPQSDNTEGV